jgi:hypothetical protein
MRSYGELVIAAILIVVGVVMCFSEINTLGGIAITVGLVIMYAKVRCSIIGM